MRRIYSALASLVFIFVACAPTFSAGGRDAYYDLEIYPVMPERATIYITKPAAFPDASVTYNLAFDCLSESGIRQNSREARDELKSFEAFASENPNIDLGHKQIRVQSVSLSCKDDLIVYKASNFNELLAFISEGGTRDSFGASGNGLDFVVSSGYRYPNLRLDYFSSSTHIFIEEQAVTASSDRGAAVPVTLIQGENLQPVTFEGVHSRATFSPNEEATLAVKRAIWDVIKFNYSQGTLAWNRVKQRPY